MLSTYRMLLFAVASMALCACSSSDGGGDDAGTADTYLRCKINGKPHEFKYRVNANDPPSEEKIHFVVISGWETQDTGKSPGFGIDLVLPEGAAETTYEVAGGSVPELDAQYYYQNYSNGQHTGTTVYSGGRSDGTSFKLTITSLTKWGVKGTFSGVLRLSGGDEVLQVTDGAFSAPYNY